MFSTQIPAVVEFWPSIPTTVKGIDKIVDATFLNESGYKKLTRKDIYAILEDSL